MTIVRVTQKALYWVLVAALAFLVYVLFLRTSGIGLNGKADFQSVISGTAYRPYIYRQLLPVIANVLASSIDGPSALRLGRQSETILGERFFRARLNGRLYPRQVIVLLVVMYLSVVGFAVAMWLLTRELGYPAFVCYLLVPVILIETTVFFAYGYMYDYTLLFLFTLSLWLMYRRSWIAYLLVFALGTLNKETTVLLLLVFAIYYWRRLPRRLYWALCAAQAAIFAVLQGLLRYAFRHNPGGALEWHLPDQLMALRILLADAVWLLLFWLIALAALLYLIIHRWRSKPLFLRVSLWTLPLLISLFIFFAWPLEIRDLLEVFPSAAILMLPPPPAAGVEEPARRQSVALHP